MKKLVFFSLMAMTFSALAETQPLTINTLAKRSPNTVMREHASAKDSRMQTMSFTRTVEHPTQIVRMQAVLTGEPQTCDEVFAKIDGFFSDYITSDRFFYNTINYCSYDPETDFATTFTINSYFDPLNDEAVTYLQKYLAEHNGKDLLGAPFQVESAQGLVVSLDLDAGIEDERNDSTLLRLQHDNESHYFTNNYKMRLTLLNDARHQLFTHDSKLVLPFISKWLSIPAGVYWGVLSQANYVELRPELIFIMDKSPKIFTPLLRLYYANHCSKYENKHCL